MIQKIIKLFTQPKQVLIRLKIPTLRFLGARFQNTSGYLQSQMDIHPNSLWHREAFIETYGGFYPVNDQQNRKINNLETWDNTRRDMLALLCKTLIEKNIEGDLAELGVYKGSTARLFHHYLPERKLHLFDTFEGFTERSVDAEMESTNLSISDKHFADTSLESVQNNIKAQNDNITYYKGYFPDSLEGKNLEGPFALIHLDADLHEPIAEALKYFYPLMSKHGLMIVHDYNAWPGARKAVDEFFDNLPELPIPMPDKSGSALIVKQ